MNADPGRSLIHVLVANSNQTQSQLFSSALRRHHGMRISCCRDELVDCLGALRSGPVDIALLADDTFDDHSRLIEMIRGVHRAYPNVGLVLLLDSYDRNLVVSAMRAGVRGLFCSAAQPFRALCRCISVVHQGQIWANTEQLGYLLDALRSNLPQRVLNMKGESLLTQREVQLVNLVAEGLPNRIIAGQLGLKENSVKKALLRVYDKLGVSNRVEVVLYALTHCGDITVIDKTPDIGVYSMTKNAFRPIDIRSKSENGKLGLDRGPAMRNLNRA